jgi:hypothetical protein
MLQFIKSLFTVEEVHGDKSKHRLYSHMYEDMCF